MKTNVFVMFALLFECLHPSHGLAGNGRAGKGEYGHRIIGLVLDAYTKSPMPNISVLAINTDKNSTDTIYTEHNGNFSFQTDTAYNYTIFAKTGIQISSPKYIKSDELENVPIYSVILMLYADNRLAFPTASAIQIKDSVRSEATSEVIVNDSLTYSVLLGEFAYMLNLESDYLSPVKDELTVESIHDDWHRYLIGNFDAYDKALVYCEELKRMGYVDAEVVANANGNIVKQFAAPIPDNSFLPNKR